MSSSARGALLVAVAALLAFLVLRGAADNSQFPLATGPVAEPTTAVEPEPEITPDDAVEVGPGTVEVDQASRLTSQLRNQGFMTREPINADDQAASTIFYRPGFAAEATVVRTVLGVATPIAPMPEPDPFIGDGIDLAVAIGGELKRPLRRD